MPTAELKAPVAAAPNPVKGTPPDAGGATDASNGAGSIQVVSFKLGAEEFGVSILDVQEVILLTEVTKIPQVPEYVCGLINLRGSVIPIIDLRLRFGMKAGPNTEQTRIIVVNADKMTVGLIVDAVEKVLRIDRSQMEPPPSGVFTVENSCVSGVVKLEQSILSLLDVEKLLSSLNETIGPHIGGAA